MEEQAASQHEEIRREPLYPELAREDLIFSKKRYVLAQIGAREPGYTESLDFYPTPRIATEKLLSVESFYGLTWEPACGDGAISKVLEANGLDVYSSDIINRGYKGQTGEVDFLNELGFCSNVITNPPFNIAQKFVEKAISSANSKVAMLLRLAWLEGQKRGEFFKVNPPSRVWVFSKRIPHMHREGYDGKKSSSAIAFAWFVWDKTHTGKTELGWI